jgi:predicted PilT family ATPase
MPSSAPSLHVSQDPSRAHTPAPDANVSSKAAGKQPARERENKLDTQSEELFPALGGPKAAAPAAPSMWSRKPAAVGKAPNGSSNGLNIPLASNGSSRASTPASGIQTPGVPSQRGQPQMSLPGRQSEQIVLHPSMLKSRDQLKKPVSEVIREINKRSKAKVEMKNGPNGTLVFEGTGPTDSVRVALKDVANQICAGQNITLPIPASIRGRVVGKQGATIQAISKRTGARINISRQEAAEILEDDDMDQTVDVQIEGDPFAVQMAKQDIEKIVNEHTSTASTRLKHIPAEYYPFLAAPGNQRLSALQQGRDIRMQIPEYTTFGQQAPQVPAGRGPASFSAQAGYPIQLSGDRQAVAEMRAELDRQVAELQRQLTMEAIEIERNRHQFVVGDMGSSINDFLAETGCSVIQPPGGHESDELIIVGPADRIDQAVDKIQDLAMRMSSSTADIVKPHASAPRGGQRHARDVTKYLQRRQAIQQIERQHNVRIVPEESGSWQIFAADGKNALKARSDIMNLISGHPPSRFSPLEVDPFYHEHIRDQAARQVRDQFGVHLIVPDEFDDSPALLVFEDRVPSPDYELPRKAPSAQDAQAYQRALQEAQQHILALISGQQQIVSRDVEAPIKFHDKIRRHVDRHQQSLGQDQIPAQVAYGGARQAPSAPKKAAQPTVNLRGPEDNVDALVQNLLAFIEQEKQDELERGFTLHFDFPQKFASHLIGRGGENINKLRDEFDVDIQLQEGKCEIKGPEAKANAAKKHILDVGKKLEDEATHQLNIPAQYHRDLIGPQGGQVNRLQDRYNVRVNFPRSKQAGNDDESGEATTTRRSNQGPNEVIIKGPSRGADQCRDELLSLLQYVKDNSYSATVSVAQSQLPSLIGSGGREMEALRLDTGAIVDVPSAKDAPSADGRAEVKIKGSKQAVEAAKKLIEERAKVFDDTVTKNIEVDRKFHRFIIGTGGKLKIERVLLNYANNSQAPTSLRSWRRPVAPLTAEPVPAWLASPRLMLRVTLSASKVRALSSKSSLPPSWLSSQTRSHRLPRSSRSSPTSTVCSSVVVARAAANSSSSSASPSTCPARARLVLPVRRSRSLASPRTSRRPRHTFWNSPRRSRVRLSRSLSSTTTCFPTTASSSAVCAQTTRSASTTPARSRRLASRSPPLAVVPLVATCP